VNRYVSTFFPWLLCFTFVTSGCSAPPPPSPSENVPSDALLQECPALIRLTENVLGKDGEIVGKPMRFIRLKRGSLHSLDGFLDEIRFKEGLNSVETEELQTLSTGLYSIKMYARGTPLNSDLPDIGAYWIDQGVKYVRMWCP